MRGRGFGLFKCMHTIDADITKRMGCDVLSETPKISVVIPAYNVAAFIVETLESALSQTFRDFEVIVVNDGSPDTDQFEEILEPYIEKIVYIKRPNGGVGIARNTAIENARGEIIAFLDGDDIWYPEFLASQYGLIESGGYDMVYSDGELFGMPSVEGQTFMETAPSDGEVTVESLLDLRCNVITSGTIARKRAIEAVLMFERERVRAEDFHLWVRIAHSGARIGYQRKALVKYRVGLSGLSSDSINRVIRAIDVFERIDRAVSLTRVERLILKKRIRGFEADLEVERGKAYLLGGDFTKAARAFRNANRRRRSVRRTAVSILSRIAPQLLLRIYKTAHSAEIAFVPDMSESVELVQSTVSNKV